jgi:hypothetical protein
MSQQVGLPGKISIAAHAKSPDCESAVEAHAPYLVGDPASERFYPSRLPGRRVGLRATDVEITRSTTLAIPAPSRAKEPTNNRFDAVPRLAQQVMSVVSRPLPRNDPESGHSYSTSSPEDLEDEITQRLGQREHHQLWRILEKLLDAE